MFVRLGESARDELGYAPFEPMPGRPMKDYVLVPAKVVADAARLKKLVVQSLEWVSSLPAKKTAGTTATARCASFLCRSTPSRFSASPPRHQQEGAVTAGHARRRDPPEHHLAMGLGTARAFPCARATARPRGFRARRRSRARSNRRPLWFRHDPGAADAGRRGVAGSNASGSPQSRARSRPRCGCVASGRRYARWPSGPPTGEPDV